MSSGSTRRILDVRGLSRTQETVAYKDGGLFPVLAVAPGGVIVAVLRGGAGHVGVEGRIDVVRSLDGGHTWTPPNVVADSDRDDRNPALGVSRKGTVVLAYHRQGSYDEAGNWSTAKQYAVGGPPIDLMITRSGDAGLTWAKPFPLGIDLLRTGSVYGRIVDLADGTLLLPIYCAACEPIVGDRMHLVRPKADCSYLVRSRDDGATWREPSLVAANMNETGLLVLPDGDLLAVMRGADSEQGLWSARSDDGGATWSEPVQVTGRHQHPADMVLLSNGDLLLTYGNRNPPYRIEGLLSRDGGRSWIDCLLTFSGSLYGYDVDAPRPTDLGYPSSVVVRRSGVGYGVTMYYYNPSLSRPANWLRRDGEPRYLARDYRAIAVTWNEEELIEYTTSV